MDTVLSRKSLNKLFSKANITDISELKYVSVPMYHINLLYIQSEQDEYALVFDSRPDLTGLKKDKVYKVEELIKILKKNFSK